MNILITAPNLNVNKNVSGISSVVNTIIHNNKANHYLHFKAGSEDDSHNFFSRIFSLGKSYIDLTTTLYSKDISLIHQNLPLNPKAIYREAVFFTIARLFRKKILLHLHGGKYLLQKPAGMLLQRIIAQMYKNADSIVCLSKMEKEIIEKDYGLKDVKVLQNTIDDLYLRLNKSQQSDGNLTILYLGRLHESKGIDILITAIKTLLDKGHTNLKFIFCGTGPKLADVLQLAEAFPNHIKYLGVVSGNAKNEILAKAQIFVLPSLYGEGLPMSLLEAMAAGLVPIVTNDGSMNSVVSDKVNGFIIQKNDSEVLSKQIEFLLADPDYRKSISEKTKMYALKNFSIQSYLYHLNEYYKISIA